MEKRVILVPRRRCYKRIEGLMDAIVANDVTNIRSILESGFNVNFKYDLHTPLTLAIELENLEIVKLLIQHGANVNYRNSDNLSPLYITCFASYDIADIARVLIKHGADLNFRDKCGYTPLHMSVIRKHVVMFDELVHNEYTDLNAQSSNGVTAIALATQRGYYEMVLKLMKQGGNPNICDMKGTTPLYVSCITMCSYKQMIMDLKQSDEPSPKLSDLITTSEEILKGEQKTLTGKFKIMKELVVKCGITTKPEDKFMPLHVCVLGVLPNDSNYFRFLYETITGNNLTQNLEPYEYASGNELWYLNEKVRFLLEHGAKPNTAVLGVSLFHYAAYFGYTKVMEHLIEHTTTDEYGINYAIPHNGATPLHIACAKGHRQIAEMLINARANINAKMKTNETPLYFAAKRNHPGLVKVLLDKGAFIDLKIHNVNPLTVAKQNGYTETVKVLNKAECFIKAVKRNQVSLVKKYLLLGAPINVRSEKAKSAIHYAASRDYGPMLTLLIHNGAEVNFVDEYDYTPLHYSAKLNSCDNLKILLSNGAIYNKKSSVTDKTPSDLATNDNRQFLELIDRMFFKTERGMKDVLELLFLLKSKNNKDDLNAILNAVNTNEDTLHRVASSYGYHEISAELNRLKMHVSSNYEDNSSCD